MRPLLLSLAVALLAGATLATSPRTILAQGKPCAPRAFGPGTTVDAAPGRAADVHTIDGILTALYDVISGPAGQSRDWDRMRSLFAPGARLIPTVYAADSVPALRVWDVEQYIATAGPRLEESGFFEREISRRTERFGGVVHAFSTYESRRAANDKKPFARGINSIQLFHDGARWWIVSVYWEAERPKNGIPAKYLKK